MHRAGGLRFHRWTRGFRQWHRIFIDGRPRASAGQQLAHLPRWVSAPITSCSDFDSQQRYLGSFHQRHHIVAGGQPHISAGHQFTRLPGAPAFGLDFGHGFSKSFLCRCPSGLLPASRDRLTAAGGYPRASGLKPCLHRAYISAALSEFSPFPCRHWAGLHRGGSDASHRRHDGRGSARGRGLPEGIRAAARLGAAGCRPHQVRNHANMRVAEPSKWSRIAQWPRQDVRWRAA